MENKELTPMEALEVMVDNLEGNRAIAYYTLQQALTELEQLKKEKEQLLKLCAKQNEFVENKVKENAELEKKARAFDLMGKLYDLRSSMLVLTERFNSNEALEFQKLLKELLGEKQ